VTHFGIEADDVDQVIDHVASVLGELAATRTGTGVA